MIFCTAHFCSSHVQNSGEGHIINQYFTQPNIPGVKPTSEVKRQRGRVRQRGGIKGANYFEFAKIRTWLDINHYSNLIQNGILSLCCGVLG